MASDYHQLEFDVRLYLTHLDCVRANATVPTQAAPRTSWPETAD
jgi:hypothetical protein